MIKYVPPRFQWPMVTTYALVGLVIGLLDSLLRFATVNLFGSPSAAVWVELALILPISLALLAAYYPHVGVSVGGTIILWHVFLVTACAGGAKFYWDVRWLFGWALYAPLAAGVAALTRRTRRVGQPPPDECHNCGYSLKGLTEPRCPECGAPFDRSRLDSSVDRMSLTSPRSALRR